MAKQVEKGGALAPSIVAFAGLLRRAGLRVGPAMVTDAIEAVLTVGLADPADFYWTLRAVLVNRHEDHAVFDEAFRAFWHEGAISGVPVAQAVAATAPSRPGQMRVAEALASRSRQTGSEVETGTVLAAAKDEVLRRKDFAQMSAGELAEARRAIAAMRLPDDRRPARRFEPDPRGRRADPRATMRFGLRNGGAMMLPRYRSPRIVQPPLVLLVDISGSMSSYARIFLHFAHALTAARPRVHVFTFSTRLTNISRMLRHRDPDEALARCGIAVRDWSGGTRIGEALHAFNRLWSRRVLGQGASVLLMTDGLERDHPEGLELEMARLRRSCRRLIWLNPLLRFDGFEPRARGIAAMLPHVDAFLPVHSLHALTDLSEILSGRMDKPAARMIA